MTFRRALACCLVLLGATACQVESQDPPPPARVLFVGNSLTYFNGLPDVVARLARELGDTSVTVEMVARPNFSLADHWDEGTAPDRLRTQRWTHVVLQQGPSTLPESQQLLREWSQRFAPLIRDADAVPVLFMVWPDASEPERFALVHDSYAHAAEAVHGIFAPAGDAWRIALGADRTLPLYGPDGFHPAPEGTWLAAVVLLARIRGIDPHDLPTVVAGSSLDGPRVRALQDAAAEALRRSPARP